MSIGTESRTIYIRINRITCDVCHKTFGDGLLYIPELSSPNGAVYDVTGQMSLDEMQQLATVAGWEFITRGQDLPGKSRIQVFAFCPTCRSKQPNRYVAEDIRQYCNRWADDIMVIEPRHDEGPAPNLGPGPLIPLSQCDPSGREFWISRWIIEGRIPTRIIRNEPLNPR